MGRIKSFRQLIRETCWIMDIYLCFIDYSNKLSHW